MIFVYAIRVLLVLVLLWDIPTVIYVLIKFLNGGLTEVQGWIAHVALMGTPLFGTPDEQRSLIRSTYITFALMLFIFPPALYLFQRWLARKISK